MSLYKFPTKPMRTCTLRTAGLPSSKSATFGMVRNKGKRAHQGVDLAQDNGYRVYAVDAGTVTAITRHPTGYGLAVTLKLDGRGLWVFYAHLSDVKVSVGQHVEAGVCLGLTGSSGNAAGMTDAKHGGHLHFEVRTQSSVGLGLAGRVDPLSYFELD